MPQRFKNKKSLIDIAVGLTLTLQVVIAQEVDYPDRFDEPMPLLSKALGDLHFEISSNSPETQAYFNQGLQLMYGFAKQEAVRYFHQSHLADPDCAVTKASPRHEVPTLRAPWVNPKHRGSGLFCNRHCSTLIGLQKRKLT